MDVYFNMGLAVLLGIIETPRHSAKVLKGLAKLYFKLTHLKMISPAFAEAYDRYVAEKAEP